MSWSRSTSIVTDLSEVTQLTASQNLTKLQDTSGLTVTDLLLTASQEIYDRLVADGLDPTKFADETVSAFKRAVAYRVLHTLGLQGHMGDYDDRRFEVEADTQYSRVRPKSSDPAQPARANEAIPFAINQGPGYFGAGDLTDEIRTIL